MSRGRTNAQGGDAQPAPEAIDPLRIIPEALRVIEADGLDVGHIHALMAAAQAVHIARTTLPLFDGEVVLTERGVRIRELIGPLGPDDAATHRPAGPKVPSGAAREAVEIGFAPLTGLRRSRVEALLEHPEAPARSLSGPDGKIDAEGLARMGSAITRSIALMASGISAADVLPIARDVLGQQWPMTETMVAMAYAKGEHMLRHGTEMFDDAVTCHRSGVLFETVRRSLGTPGGQEARPAPAAMTAVRRARITQAMATVKAMGQRKLMTMARDPVGIFRGKRDDDVVKTHEITSHLRARLHGWVR